MKLRKIICSLGGCCLLVSTLSAQSSTPEVLPAPPSASQQKDQPASPPPAAQQRPSEPQPANPAPPPSGESAKPDAASAPANAAQDDDSVTTIRKIVNEVNVVFTVTDKHGRYVKDLKKDDFKIIDDAKPATEISSFRAETDLPL